MIYAESTAPLRLILKRLKSGVYRRDADGQLEKRCSKCRECWPADNEFFYAQKGEPDGLGRWCKACYLEWRFPAGRTGTLQQPETVTA